jgi:hypothetical protein
MSSLATECQKHKLQAYEILSKEEYDQLGKYSIKVYGLQKQKNVVSGTFVNGSWFVGNLGDKPLYPGAYPDNPTGSGNCLTIREWVGAWPTTRYPCTDSYFAYCEWKP